MFPTIDDLKVYDVRLASEDIKAIQKLYGAGSKRGSESGRKKTSGKTSELWSSSKDFLVSSGDNPYRATVLASL